MRILGLDITTVKTSKLEYIAEYKVIMSNIKEINEILKFHCGCAIKSKNDLSTFGEFVKDLYNLDMVKILKKKVEMNGKYVENMCTSISEIMRYVNTLSQFTEIISDNPAFDGSLFLSLLASLKDIKEHSEKCMNEIKQLSADASIIYATIPLVLDSDEEIQYSCISGINQCQKELMEYYSNIKKYVISIAFDITILNNSLIKDILNLDKSDHELLKILNRKSKTPKLRRKLLNVSVYKYPKKLSEEEQEFIDKIDKTVKENKIKKKEVNKK